MRAVLGERRQRQRAEVERSRWEEPRELAGARALRASPRASRLLVAARSINAGIVRTTTRMVSSIRETPSAWDRATTLRTRFFRAMRARPAVSWTATSTGTAVSAMTARGITPAILSPSRRTTRPAAKRTAAMNRVRRSRAARRVRRRVAAWGRRAGTTARPSRRTAAIVSAAVNCPHGVAGTCGSDRRRAGLEPATPRARKIPARVGPARPCHRVSTSARSVTSAWARRDTIRPVEETSRCVRALSGPATPTRAARRARIASPAAASRFRVECPPSSEKTRSIRLLNAREGRKS